MRAMLAAMAFVTALQDRYPNRKLTASDALRLSHKSSLNGVAPLGAYRERVRLGQELLEKAVAMGTRMERSGS